MDMLALLDHLGIGACKGLGVSGGGNVLLHMATKEPTASRPWCWLARPLTSPRRRAPS